MPFEVIFGEFDADSETLDADYDPGDLQENHIVFVFDAPLIGDEDLKYKWPEDDTPENSKRRFYKT